MALKNGKKVLRTLADPIIEEFPLFILTLLIANLGTTRLLHGCLVAHYDIGAYEKIFRFLSVGTVVSYLSAAIAYYTKKRYIKVLLYAIPIVLFIINFFLLLNFGTVLNPTYILILGETNPGEASGFIRTFLFSKGGVLTVLALLILCATCVAAEKYKHLILYYTHKKWIGSTICILTIPFLINGVYILSQIATIFKVQSLKQLDSWGGQSWVVNQKSPMSILTCFIPFMRPV